MGLLALLASLAYHLQLPLAGVVAVDALTSLLNRTIEGELEIGELQNVSWEKLVALDVVVRDPDGREVIRVGRVAAWPDFSALFDGVIRIDRARARDGVVTLYVSGEDEDTVSLVDAFLPVDTSPSSGTPPLVVVDGVELQNILVQGDAPGYEGMRFEQVAIAGRVEAQSDVRFIVHDGNALMTGPYPGVTEIERIVGHFDSDMAEGLDFFARARRDGTRVRARIELVRPDDEAPPVMDLTASAEPVEMATLAEMEVAPGLDSLRGTYHGHARLWGPTDDLELRAELRGEPGHFYVHGQLPSEGSLVLEAWTDGELALSELVDGAPALDIGGRVRLEIEPEDPPDSGERVQRVHAEVRPLTIEGYQIPAFTLDGLLQEDQLALTRLHADLVDGGADINGEIGFDGRVDVHVTARIANLQDEPNLRRLAPDARGSAFAVLDVRADPGFENLRFDGRLRLRGARYGNVRAETLDVSGQFAPGSGPAPVIHAEGTASGLRIGEVSLGDAEVSIHGGAGGYEVSARAADAQAGTLVLVQGRATSTAGGLTLDAPTLAIDLGDGAPMRGRVSLRFRPGQSVTVDPLVLERADERVVASGTYRFNGDDDIDIQLLNVDLAQIAPLAPEALEGLGGRVDGRAQIRGDLDRRPQGELTARIRDGSFRNVDEINGTVQLSLEDTTLDTNVRLELGDQGSIGLEGPIEVTERALRDPSRLLDEATLDGLRVEAGNLDLRLLARLGVLEEIPVLGRITTTIELEGSARTPGLRDAVVVLDRIGLPGWDPLRGKVRLSYGADRVRVRHLWVADTQGELLEAEASLPFAIDDVPSSFQQFWAQLSAAEWSASVRVPRRRLDAYPRPLRDYVPPGLSASLSLTASGGPDGPHADFAAVGRYVEAATDDPCAAELRPLTTVRGTLDGEIAEARIYGFFGGTRPAIDATAIAVLPLDQWVQRGEVPEFPSTELTASVRGVTFQQVPWLCGFGSGPIQASVTAKDLLTDTPVIGAVVDLPHLRIWEVGGERGQARLSTDYRVHVRVGSTPERDAVTACTILGLAGEPGTEGARCREVDSAAANEMVSRLRVPVRWAAGQLLPAYVEGGEIVSWSDFESVRMEPALTFIPGIVSGDARMDGNVEVIGPWENLRLSGALDISDGHLQIEGLGQHLHDISGRVELHGDEALFPADQPLRAFDSGGRAVASGRIGFEGLVPREVDLSVATDRFPIRQEGMVLAWLSGSALIGGQITDERTETRIRTRGFTVRLPAQQAGSLQSLEPHHEVLVVGGERPVGGAIAARESYTLDVTIDASDPFWIRRDDFTAEVRAELEAIYRDPELRVSGVATLQRGTFEIFGKRFELQDGGTLSFGGEADLNPRVNITAIYEVPGRSTTVTVHVTGTLTDPQVRFESSDGGDRAEVIALLVSGGRQQGGTSELDASQEAASFLAGLTAGILTLGLRQEFGDVIPVLAIESQGLGGTRIRAGFNANELIPDFLRDFVTGMYIEGFLSAAADGTNAAGSSSGSGGVGGGVNVELTLPESFILRGSYVPVDNGSLDVLWEP